MHADVVPPAPNEPIIARGFIQGLQRSLFGNCLGGGHAELVLTGTYRLPEAHLTEPQLIKTFEDRLADGQPALIGLPNGENLTPTRGTVEIVGGKGSTLVNLSFTVQGDRVSLQQNAVRSDIPVDVQLRQDGLMVVPH